ncbi:hypothetical protein [uncultured Algibacter sp.]|uniref:hypothetical protein n=1 Tax=uncultured Algibacter sp. TaxID=298659 RepID=UPI00261CF649|nr:hypothetical protein [uncultured Algibacter sp.]
MKYLIDLNKEIEKIVNPEIYFHEDYQTFSFFKTWVVEIDDEYFNNWENRIKDKINHIADLDSPIKVKFIKVFHQDVLQKYNNIIEFDNENLEYLKSLFSNIYRTPESIKSPKNKCKDFSDDFDSSYFITYEEYEHFIYKLGRIFYSKDFLPLTDPDETLDDEKGNLEELILERIEIENEENEKKKHEAKEATRKFLEKEGDIEKDVIEEELSYNYPVNKINKNEELEKMHSYVQLSICLDSTKTVLKNIIKHLDNILNLIKKLETYKEDEFNFDEVFDKDPTNLKLEFKTNKLNVVFFYKALFEEGFIDVDSKNQKYTDTNLKKYLDNANIHFLNEKGESVKVKGINKEFSKVKKRKNDEKSEYERQEIELLDLIISKFSDRRKKIYESM